MGIGKCRRTGSDLMFVLSEQTGVGDLNLSDNLFGLL